MFQNWWSNLASLFKSDLEPEEVLESKIFSLEQQLLSLRQSLAQGTSSLRKNERIATNYLTAGRGWYRQAKIHLYHQNIPLTKEALENYRELNQLHHQVSQQIKNQEQIICSIRGNVEQLETKIAQIKSYRSSFNSRSRTAEANQHFYEQIPPIPLAEVITQWEDQVRHREISLGWEGSLSPSLEEELEQGKTPMLNNIQQWLEAEPLEIKDANIDQELANLKQDLDSIN